MVVRTSNRSAFAPPAAIHHSSGLVISVEQVIKQVQSARRKPEKTKKKISMRMNEAISIPNHDGSPMVLPTGGPAD